MIGRVGALAELGLAVMTGDLAQLEISGLLADPDELGDHLLGAAELDVVAAIVCAQLGRLDEALRRAGRARGM